MRVSKPPQERRAELVAAARQLFDERGVAATRISDIVGRVGVAQGVFYYYFGSKQEVVREVAHAVSQEMQAATDAVLGNGDAGFSEKLARLIALFIRLADQFLADGETSLAPLFTRGEAAFPAAQSARVLVDGLNALVEDAAKRGELTVDQPAETARVVLYGLVRLAEQALPTPAFICAVAERALGLPQGEVYRHLRGRPHGEKRTTGG